MVDKKQKDVTLSLYPCLLKITIFRSKQGLALRGHIGDKIEWQACEACNAMFPQLVHFRAEIVLVLADLQGAPKNGQHTSKTIHNYLETMAAVQMLATVNSPPW